MKCPYCGVDDFDLIGLKYHLLVHCKIFEETEEIKDVFNFKTEEN